MLCEARLKILRGSPVARLVSTLVDLVGLGGFKAAAEAAAGVDVVVLVVDRDEGVESGDESAVGAGLLLGFAGVLEAFSSGAAALEATVGSDFVEPRGRPRFFICIMAWRTQVN